MRIISIANQKGGCGKTTTAVNLAACLSVNNRKVLLIDLDPQSHATLGLNVKSDLSIYNVLSKLTNRKARLEEIIQGVSPNFDLAPSSVILSTLEQELAGEIGRESRLWETLDTLKDNIDYYDYVLIDCPPNLGLLTINAIRASGEMIVPVEASRFSFEGLHQLIDIINLIKDRLGHEVIFKILVTNFDSRLQHSFKMLEKIKGAFAEHMFSDIIHVNVKLKEAQNEGTHILGYDKYCRGAKDYFSLAREIITQEEPGAIPSAQKEQEKQTAEFAKLEEKMKEVLKEELPKFWEVTFAIAAPDASSVHVAGEFNDWKVDDSSRMELQDGVWRKTLNLKKGQYRYRFVVDGRWTEDPENPDKVANEFGEMNSLKTI